MPAISVSQELCVGCEACLSACPFGAITMEGEFAQIDMQSCSLCGSCVDACPADAIHISVERQVMDDIDAYQGVWIFAEMVDNQILTVAFELLGKGRELADACQTELCAVLMGSGVDKHAEELFIRGADKVYVVDHPGLESYLDDSYARILVKMVKKYKPEIVLAGATNVGRGLIPRVATLLGTGLTADCTGLEIDPKSKNLLQTRPAFGGNIMARILCENNRPQMATVRPKVMDEAPVDTNMKKATVIRVDVSDQDTESKSKILKKMTSNSNGINIADAEVIVAGGGGLKSPEDFDMLKKLADLLNGTVAASRVAVENGWIDVARQVGQTGKTVKPRVYIAVGISGAVQHLVGVTSADMIIAINKDPDAAIFECADYGLVGDLHEIIPEMIKQFQALNN